MVFCMARRSGKNNVFFGHETFFCAAATCVFYCHETFFVQHQPFFVDMKYFFVHHKLLFAVTK